MSYCRGVTVKGIRCTNPVGSDSSFCHHHLRFEHSNISVSPTLLVLSENFSTFEEALMSARSVYPRVNPPKARQIMEASAFKKPISCRCSCSDLIRFGLEFIFDGDSKKWSVFYRKGDSLGKFKCRCYEIIPVSANN